MERTKQERREAFERAKKQWIDEMIEVGFTEEQAELLLERFIRVTMNNQINY